MDQRIYGLSFFLSLILNKTVSESIEAIMRRMRILFAGSVTCKEGTRLPNCMMFKEVMGGACDMGGAG